jgi:glycosyltransferase involved in cell wall biosynthesis
LHATASWLKRRIAWKWASFRHLRNRPPGFEIFTPARLAADTHYASEHFQGDVLHLHWVSKLIDVPSFFASVPSDLPIVWTLHDMNPFTGGCHFSSGCEAFRSACGNCAQIACSSGIDLSYRILREKRAAVRDKNLHVVAPSRWLIEAAKKSAVLGEARSYHTIPYGLDIDALSPRDPAAARRQLGLSEHAFVLGFGAASLTNRRKGFQELRAALTQLRGDNIVALVFGGGELPPESDSRLKTVSVGYVQGADRLANLYSAMSAFALPSLEDNLPQTGLEAMACGTPVVAFHAGGIPDFVIPGQTGLLARTGDAGELARQIQWLIDHRNQLAPLKAQARQIVVERFNSDVEVQNYIELYQEVVAAHGSAKSTRAA